MRLSHFLCCALTYATFWALCTRFCGRVSSANAKSFSFPYIFSLPCHCPSKKLNFPFFFSSSALLLKASNLFKISRPCIVFLNEILRVCFFDLFRFFFFYLLSRSTQQEILSLLRSHSPLIGWSLMFHFIHAWHTRRSSSSGGEPVICEYELVVESLSSARVQLTASLTLICRWLFFAF